ncbi:hypothetical protein ANCCAN_14725 [Ancylostoma caninum]|uniref:Uncharacterized protein n=1 Tax=Ancylostoma caninum TaxID=29170 RepID=A0A368G9D4_ANCCA|nr:hypothetical protein ANCCAN_14725 [Ancylostoma caninum]
MKLSALHDRVVYLFSYYYDHGLNDGLVKENNIGVIKLLDYRLAADKACARTAKQIQDPHWMAWQDLTYIYSLLADVYGFGGTLPVFITRVTKVTTTRSVRQIPVGSPYSDIYFDASGLPTPSPVVEIEAPLDELGIRLQRENEEGRSAPPPAPPLGSRYVNVTDGRNKR